MSLKQHYARFYQAVEQTDIMRWIIQSIHKQARPEDRYIVLFILFIYTCGITATLANTVFFHYDITIFGLNDIALILGPGILWGAGIIAEKKHPYAGNVALSIAFAALYWIAMAAGCAPLLATPFEHNLIGPLLLHGDQLLGFNQVNFIETLHHYPRLMTTLHYAYDSWAYQTCLAVCVIALYGLTRMTRLWLLASLITFVIGGFIYYCFPSLPPPAHLINGYFKISSYNLIDRFYYIHHHLPYALRGSDGLIAFPSFHACQAILNSVFLWACQWKATRHRWVLLIINISLTILNSLLLLATITLGFHYLVDIIAGALLGFFGYWAAGSMTREMAKKPKLESI